MFKESIRNHVAAKYPAIWIETPEELRAVRLIAETIHELNRDLAKVQQPPRTMATWAANGDGLRFLDEKAEFKKTAGGMGGTENYHDVFQTLSKCVPSSKLAGCVIIVKDVPTDLKTMESSVSVDLMRVMKDAFMAAEDVGCTVIFLGQRNFLPPEIKNLVTVVDFPLPERKELRLMIEDTLSKSGTAATPEEIERASDACTGMTESEATNSVALAIIKGRGKLDIATIYKEKCQVVQKSGLMEVVDTNITVSDVGGNDLLVSYLKGEVGVMTQAARDFKIKTPKGILVDGFGGTGKSLLAKAAGSIFGWPVIRLDIGTLFGSLVGQSEQNLRAAIKIIEAVAPVVLWLDEFEKATAGMGGSSNGDSGVSNRMYSQLLNWMQECQKPVYRFATTNNAQILDAPLLRAGRWDEIFYSDFPGPAARESIWKIHLAKAGCKDEDLSGLISASENWTGAEIEDAVQKGLRLAFREKREFGVDHVESVLSRVRLSHTKMGDGKISEKRAWWAQNALPAETKVEKEARMAVRGRRV